MQERISNHSIRQVGTGLAVLLMLSLCGCFNQPKLSGTIQEPPYIPTPPKTSGTDTNNATTGDSASKQFADLLDRKIRETLDPRLTDAVSRAIRIGVVRPTGTSDRFEPDQPIHYQEFRQWVLGYQNALLLAGEGNQKSAGKLPLVVLPEEMGWEEHRLDAERSLTRQEFCALMILLKGKDAEIQKLDAAAIEKMHPDPDSESSDEHFRQFKDYGVIAAWARPYVAMSYQDKLIHDLFHLTPNQLTVGQGFEPFKAISRAEALLFLDSLYGQSALAATPPQEQKNSPDKTDSEIDQDQPAANTVKPIGRIRQTREYGPNGSRTTLQVSGPE